MAEIQGTVFTREAGEGRGGQASVSLGGKQAAVPAAAGYMQRSGLRIDSTNHIRGRGGEGYQHLYSNRGQ